MTHGAIFAALICICGWLSLPVGDMAFTMQTFGIYLTLGLLGGRRGTVTIAVYLLLGVAGLPVFSGFRGGIGVLAGVTGGYLWGFFLSGLVYWALERFSKFSAMIAGQLTCYLCGSLWFSLYAGGGLGLILLRCVILYLIPDALKLFLAFGMTRRLAPHIKSV